METKLTYFDSMSQIHDSSNVIAVTMDGERLAVVLDRTIIYPQGGGQPSDKGYISSLDDQVRFRVEDARLKSGIVYHYGYFKSSDSTFNTGQEVCLDVDQPRRDIHSKYHTAGHLLDVCVQKVGLGHLKPGKGNHAPDGAFVEYIGTIPADELQEKRAAVEEQINLMIETGASVQASVLPYNEAAKLCGGVLPDYISKDASPRIVRIGSNSGCPCGGTHVHDISVIKQVKVSQVRVKKGVTKISYSVVP